MIVQRSPNTTSGKIMEYEVKYRAFGALTTGIDNLESHSFQLDSLGSSSEHRFLYSACVSYVNSLFAK